nr:hypothetical protein HK105_008240 [Polyrhizophydium stewartii]
MVSLSLVTLMLAAASAAIAAPAPSRPSFAQIDISRTAGGSKQALAAAETFCDNRFSKEQQATVTDVANKAELDIFNPAIARATSQAQKDAIQCQLLRNKILKNLCATRQSTKRGNKAAAAEQASNLKKNQAAVDSLCPKVNTRLFINSDGSPVGAAAAAPAKPAAKPAAAPAPATSLVLATKGGAFVKPSFAQIDITRTPGGSKQALAAAEKFCDNRFSKEQQATITDVANKAELDKFVPALNKAKSAAQKQALTCQLLRNKILKNLCATRQSTKRGNKAAAAEQASNLKKNEAGVDQNCPTADTRFFI